MDTKQDPFVLFGMSSYLLVDVANLMFRARHVVRGDAFTKAGMALHIIFRSLRKLVRERGCDHVVLCLEGGGSWRYKVYPQYKSKRHLLRASNVLSKTEQEEAEVFDHTMNEFVAFMSEKTRCTVLHQPGIEGDDFIARWIQLHPNDEHVILSGDSDFIQMIAPNVSIFNGLDNKFITTEGVFDSDTGASLVFHVNTSDGKLKILGTPAQEKAKHDKAEKAKAKLKPSYTPTEFSWTMEPEFWRKALFVKCIRGDTGDSIFSAYPGVRYKGSSKSIGIEQAWEDRDGQTYHWNNFMLQRWDKLVGVDDDGNAIKENVRVLDQYEFNRMLIDLTMQPQEIKDLMDMAIVDAVQKEPVGNIGMHFMKFCKQNSLNALLREANDHATYLNSPYSKAA